jgi:hypothetical protein
MDAGKARGHLAPQRQRDRASFALALAIVGAIGGLVAMWWPDGLDFLGGFAVTALSFIGLTVVSAAVGREGDR